MGDPPVVASVKSTTKGTQPELTVALNDAVKPKTLTEISRPIVSNTFFTAH
jgi:hypothetical protein